MLANLDVWLRERVRAKSMISDAEKQWIEKGNNATIIQETKGLMPPPRNDLNESEISALTTTVNANC